MEVIWHQKAQEQFEKAMDYCLRQFGKRVAKRIVEGPAKLIYTVEDGYIFIHLYWDCRRDPIHLMDLIKEVD